MSLSDEIIGVIILSSFAFVILTVYLCKCYYDCTIGKQTSKKKAEPGQEVSLIPVNSLMADVEVTLDPYDDNDDRQFSRACHNDLDMVALSLHTFNRKQSLRQSHYNQKVTPGIDPDGIVGLWQTDMSDHQDCPIELDFPGGSELEFYDPKTLSVPVQVHQTHSQELIDEAPEKEPEALPTYFEAKAFPVLQQETLNEPLRHEEPNQTIESVTMQPVDIPKKTVPLSYVEVMVRSLPATDAYVQNGMHMDQSGMHVDQNDTSENVAPNQQEKDDVFFIPETGKPSSTRKGRRKSKGTLQTLDDCLEPTTRKKAKKPKAESRSAKNDPPPSYSPMSPGLGRSSQL